MARYPSVGILIRDLSLRYGTKDERALRRRLAQEDLKIGSDRDGSVILYRLVWKGYSGPDS